MVVSFFVVVVVVMLTPILVEDEPDEDVEPQVDTTTLYAYTRLLRFETSNCDRT